jgi:hypothetical protein
MKTLRFSIFLVVAMIATVFACGDDYSSLESPRALAQLAISPDEPRAEKALRKLRGLGAEGLEIFLDVHASSLANASQLDPKVRHALEALSGQRDAHAARLFWYTDLEQAKIAAQKLNRPILSLRLLGRLDEELSCANSRFFRIALYPNKEINRILRSDFVLHWESVRPAPRITVDFGDGRKLERTITGNSIHYVLTPDGQPIEAIPGLYGPDAFRAQLQAAKSLATEYAATAIAERPAFLRKYHQQRLTSAVRQWSIDLARTGGASSAGPVIPADLEKRTTPERWTAIAHLRYADARLDEESRKLIRAKNPNAVDAGRITVSKAAVEDPLLRAMSEFERSMAEDTVRNEYQLHTRLHQWFAEAAVEVADVRRLNNRVYGELFLMPNSDPWLGLRAPGSFSGVELDGASVAAILPR